MFSTVHLLPLHDDASHSPAAAAAAAAARALRHYRRLIAIMSQSRDLTDSQSATKSFVLSVQIENIAGLVSGFLQ